MKTIVINYLPSYLSLFIDGKEHDTRYYEYENSGANRYEAGYMCIRTGKSVVYAVSRCNLEAAKGVLQDIISDTEQVYRYANYAS